MIHKIFSKKKDFHPSIFMVILWVNLLSILLVSGFNYFVFHRMSNNAYLESFIQYNHNVTDMAFKNIDKQIMQSVLHIPQLYFSPIKENEPLLSFQEEGVLPSQISAFVTEMNKIKKSYPFVKSIDLYYEGSNMVVTGFDKVHYPEDEERFHQYLPWYAEWQQHMVDHGFIKETAGAYAVDGPVITYVSKIVQPKWKGKSIILAVHLSPDSFGEYINEGEGALAIMTREGQIFYDTTDYGLEQLPVSDVIASIERSGAGWDDKETPLSLEMGNDHLMVFHDVSTVTGLEYFYRIENNQFYSEYNATKQIFMMNFIISIGFNLLMLALISYYNYSAYRKRVINASKEAGLAIGAENYSFNTSLNMLTKEISVLNKTINSSKGLLFQSEVRSIMLGKNPEAAYEKLSPYLTGDSVCVFFLYLSEEDDRRLSVERLQDEFIPGDRSFNVLFTTLEKVSLVAVLLCDDKHKEEDKKSFMKEMGERWSRWSAVSGLTKDMENDGICVSYQSALKASGYRYIFTEETWLTYEDLQIENRKGSGSHLRLFEIMERDIKSENFLDFKARMEGLVVSIKSKSYTIDYCNSTLRDLVTLLYRIMQQSQLDMLVVFGYDIREYYKLIPNIDAFYEWANYLCEAIIRNIQLKKQFIDMDIKEKITNLIDDNLENNISLDFLADKLDVRLDVASRMFRQTMGKGYTDYIKERKLNRSIELMEEGYTIKDIAERLGYSSAQYFIKVFKESYGTTPYQYKKKAEMEKQK